MNTEVYGQLLAREDWAEIQRLLSVGFEPSLATTLAARSHELLAENRIRHALLEAASALEVAIQERFNSAIGKGQLLRAAVQSFWKLPLPAQLVAAAVGLVSEAELQRAIEAIERRNAIVHEGLESTNADADLAESLLAVVRKLTPGPPTKFPSIPNTNTGFGG